MVQISGGKTGNWLLERSRASNRWYMLTSSQISVIWLSDMLRETRFLSVHISGVMAVNVFSFRMNFSRFCRRRTEAGTELMRF